MSGYVKVQKIVEDFDGDTVQAFVRPIGRMEFLELADLTPLPNEPMEVQEKKALEMFEKSSKYLHDHFERLEGLVDAAGNAVSIDELFRDAYFIELLPRIFGKWFRAGTPKDPRQRGAGITDGSAPSISPPTIVTGETVG